MNDKEGKKAPEELTDEALDAVAGGQSNIATPAAPRPVIDGAITCSCGTTISVGSANDLYCPQCGTHWHCIMGGRAWQNM